MFVETICDNARSAPWAQIGLKHWNQWGGNKRIYLEISETRTVLKSSVVHVKDCFGIHILSSLPISVNTNNTKQGPTSHPPCTNLNKWPRLKGGQQFVDLFYQ